MKQQYCYLNGKILPENEAKIGLHDIGLLRGYGLFESVRTYSHKPFLLKDHFIRFERSAKTLNIKLPISYKELNIIINKLIKKNNLKEASIKMVLTGGNSEGGLQYKPDSPTFFVITEKLLGLPKKIYQQGIKLITRNYLRNIPEIKSTNYLEAISQSQRLKKEKAFELLFTYENKVLESQTGNFFMFKKNKLITPKKNVLLGVTRNYIIKLAKDKFTVIEKDIREKELKNADECFITGSHKEIVPVTQINNQKINNAKVGQNTKYLMTEYKKSISQLS